jgi:hypothetical protein
MSARKSPIILYLLNDSLNITPPKMLVNATIKRLFAVNIPAALNPDFSRDTNKKYKLP